MHNQKYLFQGGLRQGIVDEMELDGQCVDLREQQRPFIVSPSTHIENHLQLTNGCDCALSIQETAKKSSRSG